MSSRPILAALTPGTEPPVRPRHRRGTFFAATLRCGGPRCGWAYLDIDRADDGTDLRSGPWRLNIAAGEQGRGYGRFAVEAVAAGVRRRGCTRMCTTYEAGHDGPERIYLGLGFRPTGELAGQQTVAELDLTA